MFVIVVDLILDNACEGEGVVRGFDPLRQPERQGQPPGKLKKKSSTPLQNLHKF